MSTTIENIRGILSENRPEDALTELQGWLAAGDRNLMKSLVALKRNQGKSRLRGDLRRLIDQIEHESPKLNKFLSHYHAANDAFDAKHWEEAQSHLQQAITLHQPEYLALKKDLQRKLNTVTNHQKLEALVESANKEYEAKNWAKSLEHFLDARKHYFPGCPWGMDEFERVISNCKRAIAYTTHVGLAKKAQNDSNWKLAVDELNLAITSYHADCEPALSVIEEEIRWSNAQMAATKRDTKLEKPVFTLARKFLLPLLFTGTIAALVWLFLQYPSWSADSSLAASNATELNTTTSSEEFLPTEEEAESLMSENSTESTEEFLPAQEEFTSEPTEASAADIAAPPVPSPALAGSLIAGEEVQLTIGNFSPGFTYRIDYGDGNISSGKRSQTHSYQSPGTYQLTVTVSNQTGGGNSLSRSVTIAEPEPEITEEVVAEIATPSEPLPAKVETVFVRETPAATTPAPVATPPAPAANAAPRDLAEVMPQFPGGSRALKSYLETQTRYPEHARENELEGKVYVQFVVNADGSLSNVRLARGIGYGCDEEALRLVRSMPSWVPGSQQGQAVPVRYTLPITFVLK